MGGCVCWGGGEGEEESEMRAKEKEERVVKGIQSISTRKRKRDKITLV